MKKVLAAIFVLAVLVGMTACGNSHFKSQEDMFAYLNGMWVVDDLDQDEYYIFQDGQVQQIEDWSFKYKMESYMDDVLKNTGLEDLCRLDYKSVLATLRTEEILGDPYIDIEINYRKGTIVLNKDKSNEKHIIINKGSVGIKHAEDKDTTLLKKIADEVDFSGAHFEDLFNDTKNNYAISTTQFWVDTKEYGAMVKAYNPEVDGWDLITQNETTTIYKSSEWVPNISGSLMITDTSVIFNREISLLNSWNSNIDWNPTFTVYYAPNEGKIMIIDEDNIGLDLPLLIQYGANAVRKFPGAYDDYMELYDVLASEQGTVNNGTMIVEKTISGLTYKIQMGTNGTWAIVTITANGTIALSDIAKPQNDIPITADFADKTILNNGNYHHCIVDTSEYMVQVAFQANETLRDVSFTSLTFAGDSFQMTEELYYVAEMNPDKPLVADVSFPGIASIYGISFTDSDGTIYNYAVSTSGQDDSLILTEYTP